MRRAGRDRMQQASGVIAGLVVVGWLTAGVVAAAPSGTPVPPKDHVEQHTYDEKTGQWVRTSDPVPGTEDGDLDIARQWMAREEYGTAREILLTWCDTYGPDAPRYPEAPRALFTTRPPHCDMTAASKRSRYSNRHTHETFNRESPV